MFLAANELMAGPTSCCRSGNTDLVNGKRWSTPDQTVRTSSSANT
jgi:hypothetical protein